MLACLMLACVLGASGCGRPFAWEGTWIGSRGIPSRPGDNPGIATTANKVKVTLTADGTFAAEDSGVPIEGDVENGGDELTLKPAKVLGMDARRSGPPFTSAIRLRRRADGSVTFRREATGETIQLHRTSATLSPSQP